MRGAEGEERRPGEEVLTPAPFLGHGIGLRREHYAEILAGEVACDWFEAISENYMAVGGRARKVLLAVRERYPVTLHGVSLGIGNTDPRRFGEVSSLVEWDDRIPEIGVVLAERDKAAAIAAEARAGQLGLDETGGESGTGAVRAAYGGVSGQRPLRTQAFARSTENGPDPILPTTENGPDPIFGLRGGQGVMMGLVRAPEGVAKALEERGGAREEVAALFAGDARMSAVARLEVYAGMYFFRLRDSLAEDFARTAAALGEARWHNLVTDYLLAHPPTSWSLRWAGEALPEFLRAHAYGAERPWLSDVAALEQARNEAFQALDATPLRPEELAFVLPEAWPRLRFVPAPGTALVSTRWDLAGWWGDAASGEPPGALEDEATLLVFRDAEDDVRHEAIAPEEAEAARLLLAGAPFAEVCGAFADAAADETDAARRALALVRRMGSGLHSTLCGDAECRV